VAFCDIVIVLVPIAVMTALLGMPDAPTSGCPTTRPAVVDTLMSTGLPETWSHKNEATGVVAVAAFDIVTVNGAAVPSTVMTVPAGMPVPEMGCPTTRPDTLPPAETCTFVSRLLPDVARALNMMGQTKFVAVVIVTAVPAAVAFADIVTVLEPTAVMTVLAGMPVPRRA
jgi:hypothetical protein